MALPQENRRDGCYLGVGRPFLEIGQIRAFRWLNLKSKIARSSTFSKANAELVKVLIGFFGLDATA